MQFSSLQMPFNFVQIDEVANSVDEYSLHLVKNLKVYSCWTKEYNDPQLFWGTAVISSEPKGQQDSCTPLTKNLSGMGRSVDGSCVRQL